MCRYCAFSAKIKHPILTRPISNPQNPFSTPKFWSPGFHNGTVIKGFAKGYPYEGDEDPHNATQSELYLRWLLGC